jgi:hypothetical protein
VASLDQLLDSAIGDGDRVDAISEQARRVDVGRAVLTFVAAVFVGVGRLLGRFVTALVWVAVAVRVGYRDVRPARVSRPPGGGRGSA